MSIQNMMISLVVLVMVGTSYFQLSQVRQQATQQTELAANQIAEQLESLKANPEPSPAELNAIAHLENMQTRLAPQQAKQGRQDYFMLILAVCVGLGMTGYGWANSKRKAALAKLPIGNEPPVRFLPFSSDSQWWVFNFTSHRLTSVTNRDWALTLHPGNTLIAIAFVVAGVTSTLMTVTHAESILLATQFMPLLISVIGIAFLLKIYPSTRFSTEFQKVTRGGASWAFPEIAGLTVVKYLGGGRGRIFAAHHLKLVLHSGEVVTIASYAQADMAKQHRDALARLCQCPVLVPAN